jgi:hypothetical protein
MFAADRTFDNVSERFLSQELLSVDQSPLIMFFSQKLLEFLDPIGPSITPKVEEYMILLTRKWSEFVNMKAHILGGHHKAKNLIRDLSMLEIGCNSPQGSLQHETHRVIIQTKFASPKWCNEKEFLETDHGEEINRLTKTKMNGRLNTKPQMEIEIWEIHRAKSARRKTSRRRERRLEGDYWERLPKNTRRRTALDMIADPGNPDHSPRPSPII